MSPPNPKKIRILLADDHTLIRRGLRLLIEQQPELTVVGEAEDGRQAVSQAAQLKPDVAVLDIGMPNLNGSKPPSKSPRAIRKPRSSSSACIPTKLTSSAPSKPVPAATSSRIPPKPISSAPFTASPKANRSSAPRQPRSPRRLRPKTKTHRRRKLLRSPHCPRTRSPPTRRRRQIQQRSRRSPQSSVYTVETHRSNIMGNST